MERSITAATSPDPDETDPGAPEDDWLTEDEAEEPEPGPSRIRRWWTRFGWTALLVVLCLVVYTASNPNRINFYIHFVWQSQAWLDGQTSIPTHDRGGGTPQTPSNDYYQDVEPVLDADGVDTNRGIIPFPPLPALVLLPAVAVWHMATNEQMLGVIITALDVGIAFWMLGFLPIRPGVRRLTALFLGFGTVLWYAAAIGTTWFFAHVVAVGCLLWALGLALSADREWSEPETAESASAPGGATSEDQPLPERRAEWLRVGWRVAASVALLAVTGGALFLLAKLQASVPVMLLAGVAVCVAAAILGYAVARSRDVLAPLAAAVAVLGGVPALLIFAESSSLAFALVLSGLLATGAALSLVARYSPGSIGWSARRFWAALSRPESRQVAAGLLFGLACAARLTIVFGFAFFLLVGGGRGLSRRVLLAGAGATVPLIALLVYTYASTGSLFNPAYDYLYSLELGYAMPPFLLPYHANLAIEDLGYVPQNFGIMLLSTPHFLPTMSGIFPGYGNPLCLMSDSRGLFSMDCPIALPDAQGMSVILTSPAYLLAPLALIPKRGLHVGHIAVGATIAVGAIAFVNVMHFSQGWVQFGYRFSNDFAPFAIVLVALGANRLGRFWPLLLVPLLVASIAVNLWGTIWGVMLGW